MRLSSMFNVAAIVEDDHCQPNTRISHWQRERLASTPIWSPVTRDSVQALGPEALFDWGFCKETVKSKDRKKKIT